MKRNVVILLALCSGTAWAQSQQDETVKMGTVRALAGLCGLRDESWVADLGRATIQSGGDYGKTAGALAYADHEALESFAEAPPEQTCGPLAHSPALAQADDVVRRFRAQPGS